MLRRMGFEFGGDFDPNNGAKGKIPVTRREWVRVGLDSDIRAYNLLSYLLQNCLDVLRPSTFVHIAEKYLQLAATNQHDGDSYNTRCQKSTASKTWGLYWTLWKQNRNMVLARLKLSAVGAPNQGGIFTVDEMKTLTQWKWRPDCGVSFVNWLLLRFQCTTMLFSALRQENFDRWRQVGTKGLRFDYDHLDDEGKVRPICISE